MGDNNTKMELSRIVWLVGIVGAIIGLISFFLMWVGEDVDNGTGLWILQHLSDMAKFSAIMAYAPLLALIFSIIALIVTVLPFVKEGGLSKSCSIVAIIAGIMMIVAAVLWMTGSVDLYGISFKPELDR